MKYIHKTSWLFLVLLILSGVSACNEKTPGVRKPDPNPGLQVPHYVNIQIKENDVFSQTKFTIDHFNRKIYNSVRLPYKTELDTVFLRMMISSETKVEIKNLTTNETFPWTVEKMNSKSVKVKGGKLELLLSANINGVNKTEKYLMNINVYSYDPNVITWEKKENVLPVAAADSKFITLNKTLYWVALDKHAKFHLYEVLSVESYNFRKVEGTGDMPAILPHTLTQDTHGRVWGMAKDGEIYSSSDLKIWEKIQKPDAALAWTSILYDANLKGSTGEVKMLLVGEIGGAYKIWTAAPASMPAILTDITNEHFPVRNALVRTVVEAGIKRANLIGGTDRLGRPVENLFFTADGKGWGEIKFRGKGFNAPVRGATLIEKGGRIYIAGGEYAIISDDKSRLNLFHSDDNGASWTKMTQEKTQATGFNVTSGMSGIISTDGEDDVFFFLGGIAEDKPTADAWRGYIKKN
ncbi:DUF6242 domain-containing protein [Porphyromonas canoris]|uniref:Exo-alpha-sialidase n=1 Tax=Porphyromonas canoris TaxID=36875 RepID=A0ABR4XJ03_9PORP|nr:DUF6242 domain-containing protein [Porphyromonas canoris]KGN91675.1 hypothetical protein HQ43_06125 [Porphyromonas canoris]